MLAFNVHVYDTLMFLHIVAAIAWIGSGLFVQYRGTRLRRNGTPEQTANLAKEVAESTPWFIASSITVLVFGVAMVVYSPVFNFTDPWILIGLGGYLATFVTGNFFIRPTVEKLAATPDPTSSEGQALAARLFAISRVDQVVLVLVVADMVFKPGA